MLRRCVSAEVVRFSSLLRFCLCSPLHRYDTIYQEDVGSGPEQSDGAGEDEGPEKLAGALQDYADDDGGYDAGQVAAEVLKAGPSSGGLWTGEDLGHGPKIGSAHTERHAGENQDGHGEGVIGYQEDDYEADRSDGYPPATKGFEHARGIIGGGDPAVG